jgi:hypothetical protein
MSQQKRVRNLFNLDIKKEIISQRESGKSVGNQVLNMVWLNH